MGVQTIAAPGSRFDGTVPAWNCASVVQQCRNCTTDEPVLGLPDLPIGLGRGPLIKRRPGKDKRLASAAPEEVRPEEADEKQARQGLVGRRLPQNATPAFSPGRPQVLILVRNCLIEVKND